MKKIILTLLVLLTLFIFTGCTKHTSLKEPKNEQTDSFKLSPHFSTKFKIDNGKYIKREMFGEEGKIGIIGEELKPNKKGKWMWHLWGKKKEITGVFKVVAIKKNTNEKITLIKSTKLSNPPSAVNGAPQHLPSNVVFPSSGIWKINTYIDDRHFATIVVEIM